MNPFYHRIYRVVKHIPKGRVVTYGVVAQRLMRRLCPTCKEVWMEAPPERLRRWVPTGTPLYRAAGCPDCAMTGYRGRFSILEVLTVTPEVERTVAAGETADRAPQRQHVERSPGGR